MHLDIIQHFPVRLYFFGPECRVFSNLLLLYILYPAETDKTNIDTLKKGFEYFFYNCFHLIHCYLHKFIFFIQA